MEQPKKQFKGEIKAINKVQLNEEQKEAKRIILENQIVIITGVAGTGKSLLCAQIALDLLAKKQIDDIFISRAAIEVGKSLGYLPGGLGEKFDPYMEAFKDNLYKCADSKFVDNLIEDKRIKALPVQFIRGKTIDNLLIVEESQNLTPEEMEAILSRLGKTGKILINGDNEQQDTKISFTGLSLAIEISKNIPKVKWIKLKENHRSDLVAEILNYLHGRK